MSFQEQPQEQQPGLLYPNTDMSSSTPTPTSHSNGSFGTVFVVLAVIVVISSVACILSRFLSKRSSKSAKNKNHHHHQQHHHQGPPMPRPERREPKQGHHGDFDMEDIEFGFGKGFPNGNQFGKGFPGGNPNGKQFGNGPKVKPQVRFDFGRDPRMMGERGPKGGEFGAM